MVVTWPWPPSPPGEPRAPEAALRHAPAVAEGVEGGREQAGGQARLHLEAALHESGDKGQALVHVLLAAAAAAGAALLGRVGVAGGVVPADAAQQGLQQARHGGVGGVRRQRAGIVRRMLVHVPQQPRLRQRGEAMRAGGG